MKIIYSIAAAGLVILPSQLTGGENVYGKKNSRPNVLLIVSDDQGYADAGFHGRSEIPTPNLDALARTGVICTSGYVSHSYSSPSRAGLMTGRYQQRFGHYTNPRYNPMEVAEGLPLSEQLLPQFLRNGGYKTGWIGKWHLGATPAQAPWERGFEETFGFIGGGHSFINWKPGVGEYSLLLTRNGRPVEVTEHLTPVFGKEACDFISRNSGKPWFLYLAFNAPHTPHEPLQYAEDKFSNIENEQRRKLAGQLSMMDEEIGKVMKTLTETGQSENTLIFFFSDNGGPVAQDAVNTPLRSSKGSFYEGGIRVPFIVSWPAKLSAGLKYDYPVSSLDVFATSIAVAGLQMPSGKKYDGVNIVPYLAGKNKGRPHQTLFWKHIKGTLAVRDGDYKLIRFPDGHTELFNIAEDMTEAKDLSATYKDIVVRLNGLIDEWNKELVPPVFPVKKQ